MDCAVKPINLRALRAAVLAAVALLATAVAAPAGAQTLGDPTQPPAILGLPPGAAPPVDPDAPVVPQLQSILVSREAGGRRVAVINGEMVRPGSKIAGGAVVESVSETAVVLRRGKAKEVLRLFPKAAEAGAAKPAEK